MSFVPKLVRDKIPEIISESNKKVNVSILDDNEFEIQIRNKLFEEIEEFYSAKSKDNLIEEMADIMEVLYSICNFRKLDLNEIEIARENKRLKRGGFDKRIFLKEIMK